ATKNPACVATSHTWLRSRYRRNSTLVASEKPTTIKTSATQYTANNKSAVAVGARSEARRNETMIPQNTRSVMKAFEIDVTTRIHDGNRALVRRKPRECSAVSPHFVPSAKKSHRNRPTMRSSL